MQNGVNGTIIANNTKKPKNPQTVNQTMQRVLVNTVAQAYSELQPICYNAFQGETEGAKCMAAFQSQNLKYFRSKAAEVGEEQLSAYVNFVPVGQKGIRPAAFIVANGKLPRVSMAINSSYQAVLAMIANTYQNIIDKYDLQRGDQLTFVAVVESTEYPGSYAVKYARIIIGHQGVALKKVSTEARKSLEKFFGKNIYLETFVKVDKDWRSSDKELNAFGYNPK